MILPIGASSSALSLFSAPKHVVVDISAHGFGHLAQAAAVLNDLNDLVSPGGAGADHFDNNNLHITVRSIADEATLNERIHRPPSRIIRYQQDNGMIMKDALRVDRDKSMEWYRTFHDGYDRRVSDAARDLERLQPDLVFSDVPYLSLDAAALVGVPSVALCSLNWADVFLSYCADCPGSAKIHDDMVKAYSQADVFLRPDPSMPMDTLPRTKLIAPLAFRGSRKREELLKSIAQTNNENVRFVLIGVGGVNLDLPLEDWPHIDDVCWIFPDSSLRSKPAAAERDDVFPQSRFGQMRYIDLLASSDLVLTKTGYGTQTELVVNQVPSICISRPDWPEHSYLRAWHEKHGEVEFIDWSDIRTRGFKALIMDMLGKSWTKAAVEPTGAREAADILLHDYLLT